MSISTFYSSVQPSLLLNFARSKKLDPRITFSRASTGTRFNQYGILETVAANSPRFDHTYSPTTGITCQGLLIEDTRTNLLTFSEQFNNAIWTKSNLTVGIGSATAPNGLTTAYSLTDNATNATHTITQTFTPTVATTYSFSCFARSGVGSTGFAVGLTLSGLGLVGQVIVDLDTGVGITSLYLANNYTTFIQPYPNGWYRVGLAATAINAALTSSTISIVKKSGSTGILTYVGTGSTILIYGAQLEVGPAPSSYIQSVASSGIRSGDLAYIDLNPKPTWFNASQGSLVFQHGSVGFSTTTAAGFPAIGFARTDGNSGYSIQYFFNRSGVGTSRYLIQNNNNNIGIITYQATSPAFPAAKVGFAYTSNSFRLIRNGLSVGTAIGTTVPSVGSLMIGNSGKDITSTINSTIAVMSYYPVALSTSQLQNLTR
jgi:hypothetical protein